MSMFRKLFGTVGGLANTVTVTADAVTKTVEIGSESLDMLASFVKDSKAAQAIESDANRETMLETIMARHQIETTRQREEIKKELAADKGLAKAHAELDPVYQKARQRAEARLAVIYGDEPAK